MKKSCDDSAYSHRKLVRSWWTLDNFQRFTQIWAIVSEQRKMGRKTNYSQRMGKTSNQIGELTASIKGIKQDKYGYQWWAFGDSLATISITTNFCHSWTGFCSHYYQSKSKHWYYEWTYFECLKIALWSIRQKPKSQSETSRVGRKIGYTSKSRGKLTPNYRRDFR